MNIAENFNAKRVLVIGDVMMDVYHKGIVSRISSEAPVPIVHIKHKSYCLGGAGNVCLNLKNMAAEVMVCGTIGKDYEGAEFKRICLAKGIDCQGLFYSHKTTTKTRIIAQNQQLLRIDEEDISDIPLALEEKICKKILSLIEKKSIDAIVFQDYDKGVITKSLIEKIIVPANKKSIVIAVDPKFNNFNNYFQAHIFKPNLMETEKGIGLKFSPDSKKVFYDALLTFKKEKNHKNIVVTMADRGALWVTEDDKIQHLPASKLNVVDVCGAGDTFISVLLMSYLQGKKIKECVQFANRAAGIVCGIQGVAPIQMSWLK